MIVICVLNKRKSNVISTLGPQTSISPKLRHITRSIWTRNGNLLLVWYDLSARRVNWFWTLRKRRG